MRTRCIAFLLMFMAGTPALSAQDSLSTPKGRTFCSSFFRSKGPFDEPITYGNHWFRFEFKFFDGYRFEPVKLKLSWTYEDDKIRKSKFIKCFEAGLVEEETIWHAQDGLEFNFQRKMNLERATYSSIQECLGAAVEEHEEAFSLYFKALFAKALKHAEQRDY